MGFMQQQVQYDTWFRIEGNQGITFVPSDVSSIGTDMEGNVNEFDLGELEDYYEGEIESASMVKGFGARLSAPGYLDCTEWSVFDTEDEAHAYLDEYYPEDEDEEDSE